MKSYLVRVVMCEHVAMPVLAFINEKYDFLTAILFHTDNKSSHCDEVCVVCKRWNKLLTYVILNTAMH